MLAVVIEDVTVELGTEFDIVVIEASALTKIEMYLSCEGLEVYF